MSSLMPSVALQVMPCSLSSYNLESHSSKTWKGPLSIREFMAPREEKTCLKSDGKLVAELSLDLEAPDYKS